MNGIIKVSLIFFLHTLPLLQKAVFGLIFDGKIASIKVRDFFLQVLHPGFAHKLQKLVKESHLKCRFCFFDGRFMGFIDCCAMLIPRPFRNVAVGLASRHSILLLSTVSSIFTLTSAEKLHLIGSLSSIAPCASSSLFALSACRISNHKNNTNRQFF
jgi:hypothetical protein